MIDFLNKKPPKKSPSKKSQKKSPKQKNVYGGNRYTFRGRKF